MQSPLLLNPLLTFPNVISKRPEAQLRIIFAEEIRKARIKSAERFQRPSDWLRMMVLGVILADLAIFALANIFGNEWFEGYFPGCSAVFAGFSACIFIVRIERNKLLYDWIFAAMAYIAVGVVLANSPKLSSFPVFACFVSLFLISALARVWIGWTIPVGSSWFIAGGLTGIFSVAAIVISRLASMPLDANFVLVVDLVIQSAAVFGFAFSLRHQGT